MYPLSTGYGFCLHASLLRLKKTEKSIISWTLYVAWGEGGKLYFIAAEKMTFRLQQSAVRKLFNTFIV